MIFLSLSPCRTHSQLFLLPSFLVFSRCVRGFRFYNPHVVVVVCPFVLGFFVLLFRTYGILLLHSEATKGGLDQECLVDDVNEACREYDTKMAELQRLIQEYQTPLAQLQTLSQDLSALKLGVQAATAVDSPAVQAQLSQALQAAKQATADHGVDSTEATLAWETVEEVAASNVQAALLPPLDQECLVEQAQEACQAMEQLTQAIADYQQQQPSE